MGVGSKAPGHELGARRRGMWAIVRTVRGRRAHDGGIVPSASARVRMDAICGARSPSHQTWEGRTRARRVFQAARRVTPARNLKKLTVKTREGFRFHDKKPVLEHVPSRTATAVVNALKDYAINDARDTPLTMVTSRNAFANVFPSWLHVVWFWAKSCSSHRVARWHTAIAVRTSRLIRPTRHAVRRDCKNAGL